MLDGLSESEQMYLVSIARLIEAGAESPVPLSRLAQEMSVLPVSVNQMVRKLADNDLVIYQPYKGVTLTPHGQEIALKILRHRRLWEVFLVDRLSFPVDEASQLACRLEHTLPGQAAERLADFLGNPKLNPNGLPIPAQGDPELHIHLQPLSEMNVNQACKVVECHSPDNVRLFLESAGVGPGKVIWLVASSGDGSLLIQAETGELSHLAHPIAEKIMVNPL